MRLVLIEMRRGLARRSTRVLVAVALGLIVFTAVMFFLSSNNETAAEAQARAVRTRAAEVDNCVGSTGFGGEVRGASPDELRVNCESAVGSVQNFVDDRRFELTTLHRTDDDDGIFQGVAIFLVIGALMAGATFIGGDWRYGTIGTLLTWEPRRVRLFLAKVTAVAVVAFVICVLLQAFLGLALLPSALWRGTTEGADLEWFRGVVGVVLRASGLGACGALLGFAIATIGRNTTAALGAAFAYVAVVEGVVRGLKPEWQRWLVGENTTVFLVGHQPSSFEFDRTVIEATLIVGGYLLLAAGGRDGFVRADAM